MEKLTCYVSSRKGSDRTGNGTLQFPFATAPRAVRQTREDQRYDTIFFFSGSYIFTEPLRLTGEDSHLKFLGEEGTIFTGSAAFEGLEWEYYRQGIFVTQLPADWSIDAVYLNGERQTMARYPNEKEGVFPFGGAAGEEEIKKRSVSYTDVENGRIRALHVCGWGGNSYLITGRDESSPLGLSLRWVGDNNRGSEYDKAHLVVENIFEELDVPGEWYYNARDGRLYVYPAEGIELSSAVLEVVVAPELIHISGAEGISFQHIRFEKTARTMFTIDRPGMSYVPLLRGDWAVVRSGAVYVEDSREISIRECGFEDIGGNGIFFSGRNWGHKIEENEFIRTGATCIQAVGLPEAVRQPSFWPHELYPDLPVHNTAPQDKKAGPKTDAYPHEITIANNHMDGIGVFEKQSSGVNLSIARNISIVHNTIHNSARSCININDGCFGGHWIAHNDLFDSQKETTDHGPFNSWGRDRFWSVPCYNAQGLYGEAAKPYALLDCQETTQIYHNRFFHDQTSGHSWGIDLDDGSSNYEISYNLCLGVGIKLREGFARRVHHNILIGGQINIHCAYRLAGDAVVHNLIVHPAPWQFAGMPEGERERLKESWLTVSGNWYHAPGKTVRLPEFWEMDGYDLDCVKNVDPLFANPMENDYTITNRKTAVRIGLQGFPSDVFGWEGSQAKAPVLAARAFREGGKIGEEDGLQEIIWKGAIISNVTQGIMSALAANGVNGVYFRKVPKESEAYDIGFRSNRIYKRINGRRIGCVADLLHIEW